MNINLTLIGQIIWFLLFAFFCMKFVWPPIIKALDERKKKIADGLSQADQAERELEAAKEQIDQQLRDARQQASEIVEGANKRASQMVDEAKDQARAEGDRLKVAAQAEIEQEVGRAKEVLRKQLSVLALDGASKVLEKEVDQTAHNQLVESLAAKL